MHVHFFTSRQYLYIRYFSYNILCVQYITKLMSWIGKQINDEHIFPRNHKAGKLKVKHYHDLQNDLQKIYHLLLCYVAIPAPTVIVPVCKKILTRLYRVFVHLYVHHYDTFVEMKEVIIVSITFLS